MLSKLETMQDCPLGLIKEDQQKIELSSEDAGPVYSWPYCAGQNSYKVDKNDIVKIPELVVIKLA